MTSFKRCLQRNRIIVGLMVFAFILGSFALPVRYTIWGQFSDGEVLAADGEYLVESDEGYNDMSISGFFYNDNMFMKDANAENTDLTKAAINLAMTADSESGIKDLYSRLKFSCISYYYEREATYESNDYVPFSIGYKKVGDYKLFILTVKGKTEGAEWFNTFNAGSGDVHEGFQNAANRIISELEDYFELYAGSENKILVTGYSRGGAVANMVAYSLPNTYSQYFGTDDVFGYTYGSPNVSKNANKNLKNIHNYILQGDIIATFPLSCWGFGRNGQDHYLEYDGLFYDDFLFQYERDFSRDYYGEDLCVWENIWGEIAPTQSDFVDKEFAFKVVAAILAEDEYFSDYIEKAIKESDELNILDDSVKTLIYDIVYKISYLYDWTIYSGTEQVNMEYARIERILNDARDVLDSYNAQKKQFYEDPQNTDLDFDFYDYCYSYYSDLIDEVIEETQIWIVDEEGLGAAIEILEERLATVASLDIIGDVENLLVQIFYNNPTILNYYKGYGYNLAQSFCALVNGIHNVNVYDLWIEAEYFGYYGWAYFTGQIDELTIPSTINRIGESCFYECLNLEGIIIPDSVVTIGEDAFKYCQNLSYVSIPVDRCFDNPWYGSGAIKSVRFTYGKSGRMPDYEIFTKGLSSLQTVSFSDDVTYIGDEAFYGCSGLVRVSLPESLEEIGRDAFYECRALDEISIPSKTKIIGDRCFNNCTNLSKVTLPDSLEEIGSQCFSGCTFLVLDPKLPNSLKKIGDNCFSGCIFKGNTLIIPESIESLGVYAFYQCGVKYLTIPCQLYIDLFNDEYLHSDGLIKIVVTKGNGDTSTEGSWLCYEDDIFPNLQEITFAEGVTELGEYTFFERDLSKFKLSLPSTLKTIGPNAFYYCIGLENFVIPSSVTSIGNQAFYGSDISNITMPNTLSSLGDDAFGYCTNLESITLPSGLTSIGAEAFIGCSNLKNVIIPNGVKSLGTQVFTKCYKLQSVSLPDSITDLSTAFYDCTVSELTVPRGVTTLTADTFEQAEIGVLEIPETVTSIASDTFDNGYVGTIRCHVGSAAHRYASNHNMYYELIDHTHSYTSTVTKEATCYQTGQRKYTCECGDYYYKTIPMTEHTVVEDKAVAPTCTKAGKTAGRHCSVCNEVFVAQESIDALGHDYGNPVWSWDGTRSATATFTCKNNSNHIKTIDADITYKNTTPATCEDDGVRTYTAAVTFGGKTYRSTKKTTISAKGHKYDDPVWTWTGTTKATAEFVCENDDSHVVTKTATITSKVTKQASCEENGVRTYTATVSFDGQNYTNVKKKTIPAIGHSYGTPTWTWTGTSKAVATFACKNDSSHVEKVTATITNKVTTAATCTTKGVRTYTATVTFNGKTYTTTKTASIAAKGHSYGTPKWSWTGYTKAVATFTCKNDSTHTKKLTGTITSAITTKATVTTAGTKTYTATVTLDNKTYKGTKTQKIYVFDKSKTGLQKYNNVLYYVKNGVQYTSFTGFAKYGTNWYYVVKGKVDTKKKDVLKGTVNGVSGWWYVSAGKTQLSFTGIAANSSGSWYCKSGQVQFNYSGNVTYNGKTYKIKDGKVVG